MRIRGGGEKNKGSRGGEVGERGEEGKSERVREKNWKLD